MVWLSPPDSELAGFHKSLRYYYCLGLWNLEVVPDDWIGLSTRHLRYTLDALVNFGGLKREPAFEMLLRSGLQLHLRRRSAESAGSLPVARSGAKPPVPGSLASYQGTSDNL
jgi:hypothetical protein